MESERETTPRETTSQETTPEKTIRSPNVLVIYERNWGTSIDEVIGNASARRCAHESLQFLLFFSWRCACTSYSLVFFLNVYNAVWRKTTKHAVILDLLPSRILDFPVLEMCVCVCVLIIFLSPSCSFLLWYELNEKFLDILLCFSNTRLWKKKANMVSASPTDDLLNWLYMTSHEKPSIDHSYNWRIHVEDGLTSNWAYSEQGGCNVNVLFEVNEPIVSMVYWRSQQHGTKANPTTF